MLEGIRIARAIGSTNAFTKYRKRELLPGSQADNDKALREHVAKFGVTLYHPVGTCKMGHDDASVVDSELRVHGVDGLRVVDASVMPVIPGGNTNAPTIMIAEKAAEMIKNGSPTRTAAEPALTGAAR
jgi:choline dehydrogenase